MMKEFRLADIDLKPTRLWGGVPLFSLSDGLKLLDFCEKHDAAILGIEGFRIVADKRTPDLGCIADFSVLLSAPEKKFSATTIKAARYFIDSIAGRDILLEFVSVKV